MFKIQEDKMRQQNFDFDLSTSKIVDFDKFALLTYNRLIHDKKINVFLTTNTLIDFFEFYSSKKKLRKISFDVL